MAGDRYHHEASLKSVGYCSTPISKTHKNNTMQISPIAGQQKRKWYGYSIAIVKTRALKILKHSIGTPTNRKIEEGVVKKVMILTDN